MHFFNMGKNIKSRKRQIEWVVILVVYITIAQIAIPIQSSLSGAEFNSCVLSKTWWMVIRKIIMLVA